MLNNKYLNTYDHEIKKRRKRKLKLFKRGTGGRWNG